MPILSAPSAAVTPATGSRVVVRHSVVVRACHWINAVCLFVLLMSGLQIFNAHPMLNWGNATDFEKPFLALSANDKDGTITGGVTTLGSQKLDTTGFLGASRDAEGALMERGFPAWATLPAYQDLATGRRWHFFFAWALVINGAVYLVNLIVLGHLKDFVPSPREFLSIPRSIWDHARLRFPKGEEALRYNVLQKLAYLSVIVALPILVLAGLTMSPALDARFPWLLNLFGGRQSARSMHFLLAAYLVAFFVVHLVMVLISGFTNNMRSMITGRYRVEEARDEA